MAEIKFSIPSVEDLVPIIEIAVAKAIQGFVQPQRSTGNEFLTRKEVCEILQISPVTLHKWTKDGVVIGYRVNSRVRYKRSEIEGSLQQIKSYKHRRDN